MHKPQRNERAIDYSKTARTNKLRMRSPKKAADRRRNALTLILVLLGNEDQIKGNSFQENHRKKRIHQLEKKMRSGKASINEEDPFEMFVAATNIRYCYYSETHRILGNTYGMCVLQDFEALTPNLLARTVETVEGGGLVLILLRSVTSLRQLFTMTMDVHKRYRTESHDQVIGRFNERFLLSLSTCTSCLVVDDHLNILPVSSHSFNLQPIPINAREKPTKNEVELANLVKSLEETQPIGHLVKLCKTLDQAKAVLKFLDVITEKTLKYTVSLTAARGRGKSAALGIAVSGAVAFEYTNIFVTSPSPENLKTFFEFVCKGFDVMGYQEHLHYELVRSTNPEFKNAIIRLNVFRDHRQTIQYIHPMDADKLGQAELVVIDEAAAIPLPYVKKLLGSYLVFLASTVNGYEGTGRSLSLKLLQQLRMQTANVKESAAVGDKQLDKQTTSVSGRVLTEITLTESIRYKPGDEVEQWLNKLLCLDASTIQSFRGGCPASEAFLQRLMAIYVAAHYKNSPNDLQMVSDAPAHHLFCLLGPVTENQTRLPEILCVIEACMEGEIMKSSVVENMARSKRPAGDLIPWTVAQQFQDSEFPHLSGLRIVRIATHPDYQRMGYGSQALKLLQLYYSGQIPSLGEDMEQDSKGIEEPDVEETVDGKSNLLEEKITPRKNLPPLLLKLSERKAERLDWIGSCFGLTSDLLR
ncbi:unnamed protein product [Soboliphyme baturini]|uniref:RNA cytidine acetyltransferase n=1 Tax=Soboliphyme baturini TaxID=241478 RepID=A0A183I8V0_9BILA|nr:unnamed protein product [Soboliphyme baturini]